MSATHRLPLSLLDLTLAQAQALHRSNVLYGVARARRAHAMAVQTKIPELREGYLSVSLSDRVGGERRRTAGTARPARRPASKRSDSQSLKAPSAAALLLHDRVDSLVKHTGGELYSPDTEETDIVVSDKSDSERDLFYAENELREFYTDLLAHPESELEAQARFFPTKSKSKRRELEEIENRKREERKKILDAAKSRLIVESDAATLDGTSSTSSTLANRLTARCKDSFASDIGKGNQKRDLLRERRERLDAEKLHHYILLRVSEFINNIEDARKVVHGSGVGVTPVVLSEKEWDALTHACIDEDEPHLAEDSLLLMKRSGQVPTEELVNDVLNSYASRGDVPAVMEFFEKQAIGKPTERQRDLHIKAHLKSPSTNTYGLSSALEVLHKYESLALLPPVQSYTRVICALFSARSAQLQAQAWDLFSHMRYVAHAKPDPTLYALMIRACAGTGVSQSGYVADSVRALDLWTEMTTDAGYAPTVGAYNAIILACARSSEYVGEAFRLAREMLDGHRDAYGYPLMHATQETFDALLVAAKTRKDLPRARWILAEMLKVYEQAVKQAKDSGKEVESDIELNERTMMHVFHAYVSYRPPFRREDTVIVEENETRTSEEADAAISGELPNPHKAIERALPKASFSVTPPQTRQEVLAEADTLFERILTETGLHPSSPRAAPESESSAPGPFSRVLPTTPLLNSYLSVHYMHDRLENSRKLYEEVFTRTGLERLPRTYVDALERCQRSEKEERRVARDFAESVWNEWVEVERKLNPRSADARMIERANAAMIRTLALVRDLDSAMSVLHDFSTRYPPQIISRLSLRKPQLRSTQTTLHDTGRPLVRLTSPLDVPDDSVPPLLTPRDLELLHHRLVDAGPSRQRDMDRVTYLAHAYVGALRKRRDKVMKA